MMWYEDLAQCDYFGIECTSCLQAVGWLEQGHSFATGPVARRVYIRLVELLSDPWQPSINPGVHCCDLCLYDGPSGNKNLFVPANNNVYVCPELVAHYMNAHGYRPPEEFCAAVLACPPMRSVPYLQALLTGARPLVHAAEAK